MLSGPLYTKYETARNPNEDSSGHHIQMFWTTSTQCSSVRKPKFYQKFHQDLQCIKLGFKLANTRIWISFSPLLVLLRLHQLLNWNQLSEPTQRQNPHFSILINEPCTLGCLYSSTELLLATWGYQITSFPNQTQSSYGFICNFIA